MVLIAFGIAGQNWPEKNTFLNYEKTVYLIKLAYPLLLNQESSH